jgi:carbonic anhydrase
MINPIGACIRGTAIIAALSASLLCISADAPSAPHEPGAAVAVDADAALQQLLDGNRRFMEGHLRTRDELPRRHELVKGQKPIAVIVSCSDSRVPPELVFDQDLGDIFVIRTAGEVVGDLELGSIEYAVEHLGTPLIVVLGHQACGAVTAAVKGGHAEGHIDAIVKAIEPAVKESKDEPGDAIDNAVRANVRDVARALRASDPILSHFVHDGKVKVVGGRYDLDSGKLEILPADAAKP